MVMRKVNYLPCRMIAVAGLPLLGLRDRMLSSSDISPC